MRMSKKKEIVPKFRFPEFQRDGIDFVHGNKLFKSITNKNHNSDLPILAITQDQGAVPRDQIEYNVTVTDKSLSNYKVVEVGEFIISLRSFQGGIEYSRFKGICSPAYIILRKREENISELYYKYFFKTWRYIQSLNRNLEGIRDGKMISYSQFSSVKVPYPRSFKEQQKIADCLSSIDELIDAENRKLKALEKYKKDIYAKLSYLSYAPVIFISAKTGQRVDKLFNMINNVAEQNAMRVSTATLNQVINEAIAIVQPPTDKGKRLKILYGTQVSTKPPTFVIFVNNKELFHFSYERYLVNQIRKEFGLEGTPVRIIAREKGEKEE